MAKPVVSQPLYNIVNRQAEPEQLTAAAYHGLGVVPFSPLARGVLSGKYAPGAEPAAGSRAARRPGFERSNNNCVSRVFRMFIPTEE